MPKQDSNPSSLFILCCPRCGNSLYDPVKRICSTVPEANQGDLFCKQCHWIGQPDALVRQGLEVAVDNEGDEGGEDDEDSDFRWELER
ncbi:MAG: hypothetical protein KJ558_09075 [Gammaproteobacteria bacterium]|nr:hypothetical protein [Gammaproteobacteria bacterium]MBU1654959.1 hypothetical protein [Gammaproteobacteria bacterium]MBU1960075.1 hypothetical protein [Gammaproteobacteria bacterium]